jgi:hypothetical protein
MQHLGTTKQTKQRFNIHRHLSDAKRKKAEMGTRQSLDR